MIELLPDRLPWYVAGPVIGLCVVALFALSNQRMGVTSSFVEMGTVLRGRPPTQAWRLWFFIGLAAGAALVGFLQGGLALGLSYGALGAILPIAILIPVLFVGGTLIGYGARVAGGCTSGHGISGVSSLSPASFVATGTFMATAVLVTLAIHWLTGGAV
jgi:uncharacterized membrane protein YedE/YeeE